MSWKSKVWTDVGNVAAVEELRDKNTCRLNPAMKSLHHQHVINNTGSSSKPTQVGSAAAAGSPPPQATTASKIYRSKERRLDQSEESLRTASLVFLGIASHLQVIMTLILILNFLFHSPLLPLLIVILSHL